MANNISLLAVDDDPNMLESLSEVLELEGFDVRTAGSASAALAELSSRKPDMVLTDFQLPDGSGFELAAKITKTMPAVPVLLLTGRTMSPQEKETGRAAGVREYVVKPFNMPALVAMLRTLATKEK